MLRTENTVVTGWEAAIRGMRNPKNSWDKSDTIYGTYWGEIDGHEIFDNSGFVIGKNDLNLMVNLRNAGTDHRKFMRMITVYTDITAPLYWWKEFDTYKVGTVANSCSTMHKIHAKKFVVSDFSTEHLIGRDGIKIQTIQNDEAVITSPFDVFQNTIGMLNECRDRYLETGDKDWWWQMIQLLPSSYNQKRTVMVNYEVLANIYKSRSNHKLLEWHQLCEWIRHVLPYSELITGGIKEIDD